MNAVLLIEAFAVRAVFLQTLVPEAGFCHPAELPAAAVCAECAAGEIVPCVIIHQIHLTVIGMNLADAAEEIAFGIRNRLLLLRRRLNADLIIPHLIRSAVKERIALRRIRFGIQHCKRILFIGCRERFQRRCIPCIGDGIADLRRNAVAVFKQHIGFRQLEIACRERPAVSADGQDRIADRNEAVEFRLLADHGVCFRQHIDLCIGGVRKIQIVRIDFRHIVHILAAECPCGAVLHFVAAARAHVQRAPADRAVRILCAA